MKCNLTASLGLEQYEKFSTKALIFINLRMEEG